MMLAIITVLLGAHPSLEAWRNVFQWLTGAALVGMCVAFCARPSS